MSQKSKHAYLESGYVAVFSSGRLTNAASAVAGAAFVAPFAGTIEAYHVNIDTQFTHANAALNMGLLSDIDSHLDDYDLTTSFTGYRNLIGNALFILKTITKGELYQSAGLVASDTTGKLTATVEIAPA